MKITQSVIFWDWNGTLLNDAVVCVEAMNNMLKQRQMPGIDLEQYKSIFGFPVVNYYKELGFNFDIESFENLSIEFIANYNGLIHLAELQPYTMDVLNYFRQKGKKQVIISAMEQNMLNKQLLQYGVSDYFHDVRGISNIYAKDKTHLAQNYLEENKQSPADILFIGDTLHDKEVADEISTDIVLVLNGHQSANRLAINGNMVINDLETFLNHN